MSISAGHRPTRLGVHVTDTGIDAAVFASHATAVELCLLDGPDGYQTERRVMMHGPVHGVWSVSVPGVRPGQRYGFRAHGTWDPAAGLRYNPTKLLVDPYARGLVGSLGYGPETYGHVVDAAIQGDPYGAADKRDSADHVPHSVVVDLRDLPGPDPAANRPWVPWSRTVVYEAHVKGLTRLHPDVPSELRGTYAGLAHPAVVQHLVDLGVTTLELLPIHAATSEPHLVSKGLCNYWGYSTLGFFAPHAAYATRAAREAGPAAVLQEVRGAVHALHEAGIEVLLDVVYNHTAEGGFGGQHLSWRGLDATAYYAHDGGYPANFADVTGTGNTLDFRRPEVVRMTLDSLRFWSDVVGVDGYRFDLAVTLGREVDGFRPNHPLLVAMRTDPSLHGLKLVAEPWDVGPGGWRTGQFPPPFAEWNDRFRNAVRSFWLADPARAAAGLPGHRVRDLATRLSGSVDLFGHGDPPLARAPVASINFVTAHDGFTLADLVQYQHKHNTANGENNRDGTDDNRSWNHGVEGPVAPDSPAADLLPLRRRSVRNLLATLALSAGTPMITAGDEMGRTQRGNNNAYCHDNEISWVDWTGLETHGDLFRFVCTLIAFRRAHPVLRQREFLTGIAGGPLGRPDVMWHGVRLGEPDWGTASRSLAMHLAGEHAAEPDCDIYLAANAWEADLVFALPTPPPGRQWARVVDTAAPSPGDIAALGEEELLEDQRQVVARAYSCVVLRSV
jgi:isoamylase